MHSLVNTSYVESGQLPGRRTLVMAGGKMEEDFALSFLDGKSYDTIIAVDGGLACLRELGIMPTDIVGDFDTIDGALLAEYERDPAIRIRRFQPEKDDTDSEIAINMAIEYKSTQIDILGGTGGRLDHTIGNIRLLRLMYSASKDSIKAFLYDRYNRLRLVDRECVIKKNEAYGKYVSVFPYTQIAKGITLEGFRYPLKEHTMDLFLTPTLGISNEIVGKEGRILCREGVLLVVESRDM